MVILNFSVLSFGREIMSGFGVNGASAMAWWVASFVALQAIFLLLVVIAFFAWLGARDAILSRQARLTALFDGDIIERLLSESKELNIARPLPRTARRNLRIYKARLIAQIIAVTGFERELLLTEYRRLGLIEIDRRDLKSRRWWRRLSAVLSLEYLELPESTPLLQSVLVDPHPLVAIEAMQCLSHIGDAAAIKQVLELVEQVVGRNYAVYEILRNIAQREPLLFLPFIQRRPKHEATKTYVQVLGDLRMTEAVPIILQLLDYSSMLDADMIACAVKALGQIGDPESVSTVQSALQNPSPLVRAQAITALTRLLGPSARIHIEKLLGDPSLEVQRALEAARRTPA